VLNRFFLIIDTYFSCEDIARQNCPMVRRWRIFGDFLRTVFLANRVQHDPDLHLKFMLSKFALRPHHVWKYDIKPICDG